MALSSSTRDEERISLCETLDRVLNKGVVVFGEVVISVADIDLIYLGLNVVLTSVETAHRACGQALPLAMDNNSGQSKLTT